MVGGVNGAVAWGLPIRQPKAPKRGDDASCGRAQRLGSRRPYLSAWFVPRDLRSRVTRAAAVHFINVRGENGDKAAYARPTYPIIAEEQRAQLFP
jgi:hypothetical protein